MRFTEFIRNNVIVIVTLGLTLILTVVLGMMWKKASQDFEEGVGNVSSMRQDETMIKQAPFALSNANLDAAVQNTRLAKEQFQLLLTELDNQYYTPEVWETDPLRLKGFITNKCTSWSRQLQRRGVQTSIEDFTFQTYIQPGYIPRGEDIAPLQRNLGIVEELVTLVTNADVKSLDALVRENNSLNLETRDLYRFIRYKVSMTGNIVQVRNFLNSIHTSRMLFIVQKVELESKEDLSRKLSYPAARVKTVPANPTPGGGMDGGLPPMPEDDMQGARTADSRTTAERTVLVPLTLEERVIFRELVPLKFVVTMDYVEFNKPEADAEGEETE